MPGFCHSDPGELSFSSVAAGGWADLRGVLAVPSFSIFKSS